MTRSHWLIPSLVVGLAVIASNAQAQQPVPAPAAGVAPGTVVSGEGLVSSTPFPGIPFMGDGFLGSLSGGTPAGPQSGAIMPYSYYANFPQPARVYVGYGANDGFPFHGQPYGHAGDRWSWSAMSSGNGSLARYYYQILR